MTKVQGFIEEYLENLTKLLRSIQPQVVDNIIEALEGTLNNNGRIYILGNGGSAATASHMANDLGASGLRCRGIRNFDVVSLTDNSAILTAVANDIGLENIFYMQIEGLLKPEDIVIAISCSGNSPNIVKAVEYAQVIGCTIIGITGFDGGKLREVANIKFHVDTAQGEYGLVEDVHMILDHIIYSYYIQKGQ